MRLTVVHGCGALTLALLAAACSGDVSGAMQTPGTSGVSSSSSNLGQPTVVQQNRPSPPQQILATDGPDPLNTTGMLVLPVGALVPTGSLLTRVVTTGGSGMALSVTRAEQFYPTATKDSGRTWRIAGPMFYVPGGHGGGDVTGVLPLPDRSGFLFWGVGSNFVRTPRDLGGHRITAAFPSDISRIAVSGQRLLALISWWNTEGTQHQDIRYTSADDSARWQAGA